jgi:antitoxin (DNA-binding transcriptional repressor) of toxin-antitoxin stability system
VSASSVWGSGQPGYRPLTACAMCVIVLDMKTTSVRMVQHNLARVLSWVQEGEEVQVTRRHVVVAKIVPCRKARKDFQHPDFLGRARRIWGNRPKGMALSGTVCEDREERA